MKDSSFKVLAIILGLVLAFSLISSSAFSTLTMLMAVNSKPNVKIITNGGAAPQAPQAVQPAPQAPAAPQAQAPAAPEATTAPADTSSGTATTAPADTPADAPADKPSADGIPAAGKATFDFYKKACDDVKNNGAASFTKKNWQDIGNITVTEGKVPDALINNIKSFATGADEAQANTYAKGSAEAKEEMCGANCDFSKVKSATASADGDNIKVVIEMNEEAKIAKGSNGIASVASGILYIEDVRKTVTDNKLLSIFVKELDPNTDLIYKSYKIVATITKDGKFVKIEHEAHADVVAGATLKLGGIRIAGNGDFIMHSHFTDFKY